MSSYITLWRTQVWARGEKHQKKWLENSSRKWWSKTALCLSQTDKALIFLKLDSIVVRSTSIRGVGLILTGNWSGIFGNFPRIARGLRLSELSSWILRMFMVLNRVTCRSMTEGIWRRVDGSRLISFMMLDNRMGISLRRKLNDSASVALRPKSTNCWMDNGDGLYCANVSSKRSDRMSNSLVRFLVTGANLMLATGIAQSH